MALHHVGKWARGACAAVALTMLSGSSVAFADDSTNEVAADESTAIATMASFDEIVTHESWPNKPFYFNFYDNTSNVSQNTGVKENSTSFWLGVYKFDVDYCNFYADALIGGQWIDCTSPGYGRVYRVGQYELYNQVWERYGRATCRLGGYRAANWQGWVSGEWTPDCEGNFSVAY